MTGERRPVTVRATGHPTSRRQPTVAFICTHNACRSQIAETLSRAVAGDAFTAYSAGTSPAAHIDAHARSMLKACRGLNMVGQRPKSLDDLPPIDVVVTMGCGVQCPYLQCRQRIEWTIDDPTGSNDEAYRSVIDEIRVRVLDLRRALLDGSL